MHTYQAETETIIKGMNSKNVISAICPLKALDRTSIVRVDGVVTRRKWIAGMVAWRMGQAPGLRTCCLKYRRQVDRVLRHGVVSSHRILFSNLEFSRQRATRARSLHPALLLFSSFFFFFFVTHWILPCLLSSRKISVCTLNAVSTLSAVCTLNVSAHCISTKT